MKAPIIKTANSHSLEYEAFCNEIARSLGVIVPDFKLKQKELWIKNFLEEGEEFVSFYTILNSWQQPSLTAYVATILDQTRSLQCVENFLMMCLFDALINNDDRHNENMGFIKGTKWRFAPAFDNHGSLGCSEIYPFKGELRILTEERESSFDAYFQTIKDLGFGHVCDTFLSNLRVLDLKPMSKKYGINQHLFFATKKMIGKVRKQYA